MTRTRLLAAALLALFVAQPAYAQNVVGYRAADNINKVDVSASTPLPVAGTVTETGPAYAASGVTAVTGTLATNTISATFAPIAGRTYYVTLSGTGSATVTVIYSRDAGATWAPEATGVDGSAPIVMNKIAYAGLPVRIPLSVSESGVLTALCPGTMSSGTACVGTVSGTVPFGFTQ
jgi:hypothetical protein